MPETRSLFWCWSNQNRMQSLRYFHELPAISNSRQENVRSDVMQNVYRHFAGDVNTNEKNNLFLDLLLIENDLMHRLCGSVCATIIIMELIHMAPTIIDRYSHSLHSERIFRVVCLHPHSETPEWAENPKQNSIQTSFSWALKQSGTNDKIFCDGKETQIVVSKLTCLLITKHFCVAVTICIKFLVKLKRKQTVRNLLIT